MKGYKLWWLGIKARSQPQVCSEMGHKGKPDRNAKIQTLFKVLAWYLVTLRILL